MQCTADDKRRVTDSRRGPEAPGPPTLTLTDVPRATSDTQRACYNTYAESTSRTARIAPPNNECIVPPPVTCSTAALPRYTRTRSLALLQGSGFTVDIAAALLNGLTPRAALRQRNRHAHARTTCRTRLASRALSFLPRRPPPAPHVASLPPALRTVPAACLAQRCAPYFLLGRRRLFRGKLSGDLRL